MAAVALITPEDLEALVERAVRKVLTERELAAASPDDSLDTAEAARIADVTPDTIRDWIKRRGLPAHRPPGARDHRVKRADLEAFLAEPSRRRPPPDHGPVDLAAHAKRILNRRGRG